MVGLMGPTKSIHLCDNAINMSMCFKVLLPSYGYLFEMTWYANYDDFVFVNFPHIFGC